MRTGAGENQGHADAVDSDAEWFAAHYASLRRFAAVTGADDLDPDDLLQEALARTLRLGPLHRLEHPAAYLRRTIVHLALNHNRSKGRERRALHRLDHLATDATRDDYPSDLTDLDRLSPQDRVVLYLTEVERRPADEVAATLGVRPVTVRARASRARRRLRAVLKEEADDE